MKRILLSALIASLPVVGYGQSIIIRENYDIPVLPVSSQTFEVVEADGAGPSQMWCAAGLYARKKLGLDSGSLWISRERSASTTAPGRKAVLFSTKPVPGEFTSFTTSVRRPGLSKSIALANALCRDFESRVRIRNRV